MKTEIVEYGIKRILLYNTFLVSVYAPFYHRYGTRVFGGTELWKILIFPAHFILVFAMTFSIGISPIILPACIMNNCIPSFEIGMFMISGLLLIIVISIIMFIFSINGALSLMGVGSIYQYNLTQNQTHNLIGIKKQSIVTVQIKNNNDYLDILNDLFWIEKMSKYKCWIEYDEDKSDNIVLNIIPKCDGKNKLFVPEIVNKISEYCTPKELFPLYQTCKFFRTFFDNDVYKEQLYFGYAASKHYLCGNWCFDVMLSHQIPHKVCAFAVHQYPMHVYYQNYLALIRNKTNHYEAQKDAAKSVINLGILHNQILPCFSYRRSPTIIIIANNNAQYYIMFPSFIQTLINDHYNINNLMAYKIMNKKIFTFTI